ncbi:MAG: tetratricopeptide repeat protein [Prevotella sp.]|nr:tetratricopeptide repeat protein [Prevotella sp.]
MIAGCSTNKNTSQSRWWHAFNARYNTYFNGAQAYIDGSLEKENGNKDNFTEMLPLYTVGNKSSRELGKTNFDRAIEKAEKAIAKHSIKKRPEWTKSRRKTERDIEWLSRREYNPFLWKAWMLMGRSQFHKGAFEEAAATFAYMSRLYKGQPAIYGKARAWLAKCYVEQDWLYDAEDIIRNMQRDSMDWRAIKEWDYTYADYYLHTGDLEKAVPYLQKVIKHEMRRKQKARELYLLGQVLAALGRNQEAYKAFQRVIRTNPPYELEFNARIAETEVTATGQSKKMVSKLKRMAASDNNKEYLDQVYYAMGNIHLADHDTLAAINAYEQGNRKATRSGIEKGVLLLHLGDLYWARQRFGDAKRCYGEAIGLLDKDRKDYAQLSERSKILDELAPYTDAVQLQDSLQHLARCSEAERNAAIDRVIDALKKKEKEERDQLEEQNAGQQQMTGGGPQGSNIANMSRKAAGSRQQDNTWYFYSPTAVQQGKITFQQLWGKRQNIDNWQRINQTVVGMQGNNTDMPDLTDSQRDSIIQAEAKQDSIRLIADSVKNDPHKREYYLAQIPFTTEQLEASNKLLEDGLHHSGVIFKDRLDNLSLAEKALRRVSDDYPDYGQMDDVYYHLYLLYMRKNEPVKAEEYVTRLKQNHPKSKWTVLLSDPYYKENARFGVQMEDSLYAATYEAFKQGRYSEVSGNARISESRFPMGANRDKFLFIGGLGKLNNGDTNGCISDMKKVVEKYPQSRISEMAGMIVNGVQAGKKLRGGKFDLGDVWTYRSSVLNDSDSIQQAKLSTERDVDFKFLLIYHPDSLNENKLLFELARFNFTNFLVRNFEIEIQDLNGMNQMQVAGFRSYDEAYQYARQLFAATAVVQQMGKTAKGIIISDKNLQLVGTVFSYKDYEDFYAKHFAPLTVTKRYLLTEPAEIATPRERDIQQEIEDRHATDPDLYPDTQDVPANNTMTIPLEEPKPAPIGPKPAPKDENTFEIPTDETQAMPGSQPTVPDTQTSTPAVQQPAATAPRTTTPTSPRPQQQPATEKPQATELKQSNAGQKAQAAEPKPKTTGENPKPIPAKKPNPVDDGPIIYFGDDAPTQDNNRNNNKNNTKKNQPVQNDIEDEYYELDGF